MALIYPTDGGVPTEPSVFIDAPTVQALMADDDITQIFLYDLDQVKNLVHNGDRMFLIVVNSAPTSVVRKVIDVTHGSQYLQPGVPGDDGAASLQPSHTAGNPATDWMDAPPPGCAAVGMWAFDQANQFSAYGIQAGVVLDLPQISTHVTFGGVVPWSFPDVATDKVAAYSVSPVGDDTPPATSVTYDRALPGGLQACGDYTYLLRSYVYDHEGGFDKFYLGLLFIAPLP